jgi:hypothetical protein
VFVANFNESTKIRHLEEFFGVYFAKCRIFGLKNKAFIQFKSKTDAERALTMNHHRFRNNNIKIVRMNDLRLELEN